MQIAKKRTKKKRDKIVFTVRPFKRGKLAEDIAELTKLHVSFSERIKNKSQIKYLAKYLDEIGTKTIIEERLYFDREMLTDQWAYFPDSVAGNECDCSRVHFFGEESVKHVQGVAGKISQEKLNAILPRLEKSYLGFMVLFLHGYRAIGKTCLKRYPIGDNVGPAQINGDEKGSGHKQKVNRRIPAIMKYKVNLAGHTLSINSLGFREQDKVTSACATCALWSTFQKTSSEFGHRVLSPGEITARALNIQRRGSVFPEKKGLTPRDMDAAVRSIRTIRPYIHKAIPMEEIKEDKKRRKHVESILQFMIPIIDSGIPVVLVIRAGKKIHAICVAGYNCVNGDAPTQDITDSAKRPSLKSSKVISLIAHDDNIGPFVQYEIEDSGYIYAPRGEFDKKPPDRWSIQMAIGALPASIKTYSAKKNNIIIDRFNSVIKKDKEYQPTWFARIWKSNDYKQKILDFASKGCRILTADVSGDNDIKINEGHEKAIPKIKQMINKLLSRNLPEYVLVISARGKFPHDLVFSLAGPWGEMNEFIQIVPFDAKFYYFLNREIRDKSSPSYSRWLHYKRDFAIGPIAGRVIKDFG